MIKFHIITIFPDMFTSFLKYGILKKAIKEKKIQITFWNPRNYSPYKHKKIDHKTYGGGPGMVMLFLPLWNTLQAIKKTNHKKNFIIYLSPQGKTFKQKKITYFFKKKNLIFICGRYEGIDERLIKNEIHEEWSIGDYIVTGGELPAMIFIDAITRTIPGVLLKNIVLTKESFSQGLLDYPHYTIPEKINNFSVPKILLSGNHKKIKQWRIKKSLKKTFLKRPELLKKRNFTLKQLKYLNKIKNCMKVKK
ncbi:tRNA (guanosine(37)-N1)-methyltransferase TrmD [Buchnera aphidicola]|uniref:tRNA (guanine-N(1)-)-methyltransferase n=1 Tax=Buchnera aphidicola subsp. Tuberolachnus salignus TaxID=98804 RepID=A0A160SYY1_BUCTT|nr:tRNA (guanosine(37)-N1)-methyltransferase TrmD [Buchnera aphidicola]CUR53241.1 tRNA (guanine-N(1)-)-methyltransferase [Buchnera aphidicola (Tuberolachnus salignus)]